MVEADFAIDEVIVKIEGQISDSKKILLHQHGKSIAAFMRSPKRGFVHLPMGFVKVDLTTV